MSRFSGLKTLVNNYTLRRAVMAKLFMLVLIAFVIDILQIIALSSPKWVIYYKYDHCHDNNTVLYSYGAYVKCQYVNSYCSIKDIASINSSIDECSDEKGNHLYSRLNRDLAKYTYLSLVFSYLLLHWTFVFILKMLKVNIKL